MPCVHQSIQWSGDPPSEERGVSPEYGMGTEEKHAQTEPTPPDCLRGLLQLFAGDGSMVTMNFEAKSKKIHVCIHQGKVAMKVGGGYMTVEEYLTRKINLLASATPDESDHADAKSMAALTSAVGFSVKARRAAHARSEADSVMTAAACRGDASCDVNANTDAASSEKVPHVPGDTITNTAAPISPSPYGNTNLAAQDADRCRLEGSAAEFLLVDSGSQDAPANVVSRQGPPCRRKGTSSRRGSVVHSVDETEAEANLRTLVKPRSAQQPRAEFSVRSENESGESTSFLPVIERQGRSCAFVNERAGSSEKYHRPGPLEGGRDKRWSTVELGREAGTCDSQDRRRCDGGSTKLELGDSVNVRQTGSTKRPNNAKDKSSRAPEKPSLAPCVDEVTRLGKKSKSGRKLQQRRNTQNTHSIHSVPDE
mmetsp:Transcript_27370/g.51758  ORF Transcript_27370/g.51758 Transcript_27370/m.51758 type:complete len:424 (-) Transcript_27370:302-1573(-)